MYNPCTVRFAADIRCLLFALLVAAFVSFYPQLDAAGYCDGGGCPEVSHSTHVTGSGASGSVSFVVAALVAVPGVLRAPFIRLAPPSRGDDDLSEVDLPPEVPPPQPSA